MRVKAVYLAIGLNLASEKEVRGLWIALTEGAKFWLQEVMELKNRGVQDVFIACVDGLKGFPEAFEAVYPRAAVHLCVVLWVRHSLNYVSWKMRKAVAADLRRIYTAPPLAKLSRCSMNPRTSGTMLIRPSASPSAGIGCKSRRSLTILQRYGRPSIRPMRLNR